MKNKLSSVALAAISLIFLLVPVFVPAVAFADHAPINSEVFNPDILAGPLLICTGTGGFYDVQCSNLCDLVAQIANIIYFAIGVVIWLIAPILIAVGGIYIMLGGANPGMIETGKKTITGAIWGIVIVLCAWLLVATFVKFFGITQIGGFGAAACPL